MASVQFNSFDLKELNPLVGNEINKSYSGVVTGSLNVKGTCTEPKIKGTLIIAKGHITLSNFGRRSFENIVIDTTGIADLVNRFNSLQFNINIEIGDDFYIRNKRFLPMEIKLKDELMLTKQTGQKVQLTGKLKVVDGFTVPLTKRFKLVKGSFTFFGPVHNPKIYLKNLYEPHRADQPVKIYYIITGTVEDPVFKFNSDPPMEPKNIISYTIFSRPFYGLGSVERGLVKSIADRSSADYTGEVLVNRMELIATRKLSVDVVRIDNTTAESGTVITTGWYINPKVFFAIQNIIAGKPRLGFYLEYYLNDDLKLILSQDNDYGQGIDLQYEYDY